MSVLRRDKRRERYSRNTQGWNAQGFFSPNAPATAAAIATEATLQAFVYADLATKAGLIGLYKDDGAVLPVAAPAAGLKFNIVQKNSDDTIKKSTELVAGQYTVAKTDFDAPMIQKDHVGYNGVDGDLNISIVGGLQEFVLSIRETTPANQPFPIMEGRAIVRSGSPINYDIAAKIANDIKNTYDFERNGDNVFAAVSLISDMTPLAITTVAAKLTFTDGSNQIFSDLLLAGASLPVVGGFITAIGDGGKVYKVLEVINTATTTTIVVDQAVSLSGGGSLTLVASAANIGVNLPADMTAATMIGFLIEGKDELTHFTVSVSEDLGDADIKHSADWNFGSGAGWQVAAIEDECAVFDGFTTLNEAWVRDFGQPDLWVDDSAGYATAVAPDSQYVLYIIESMNRIIPSAGAPQNQTLMKSNLIIAAISGSALETALDTIFAV